MLAFLVLALQGPPEPSDRLDLVWSAPRECPSQGDLEVAIGRALAQSTASRANVRVRMVVQRDAHSRYRLHASITTGTTEGIRQLEAGDCGELAEAAALVVAIAIDPSAAGPIGQPATDGSDESDGSRVSVPSTLVPVPQTETNDLDTRADRPAAPLARDRSEPRPVSKPAAPLPSQPSKPVGIDLRAHGGVGTLALPQPVAAMRLSVAIRHAWFGGELLAEAWTPARGTVPGDPRFGGRFVLWSMAVRGCGVPSLSIVSFPMCVGIHVGAVHGEGRGQLAARRRVSPWVAAVAAPGLSVAVHRRLSLGFELDVMAVLARPSLVIDGLGEVCCESYIAVSAFGGLAVKIR